MDPAQVRKFAEERPFTPFKLILPSDRELEVPHPEFFAIAPKGSDAVVWDKDGIGEHVDLRLVVSVKRNGAKQD